MPEIPQFQRSQVQGRVSVPAPQLRSTVSPEAAGAPGRAAAQLGNVVAGLSMDWIEREQRAERDLKALEMSRDLDEEISQFTESFQGRQDYEKFEGDTKNKLDDIRSRYQQRIGGDRVLQTVFERLYNQTNSQLNQFSKTTKFKVMSDRALSAFNARKEAALQSYASSLGPQEREIILNDLEVSAAEMVTSGYMENTDADVFLRDFTNRAEEARADQAIDVNSASAEVLLRSGEFNLNPQKLQEKIEKSQVRQRQVAEAAEQAEAARVRREQVALKEAHDSEERSLGELFLSGNYESVVPTLMKTEYLTGDELRTWSEAARTRIESIGKDTDKSKQAESIVTINARIARSDNPDEIRRTILTDPYLTQENQEQYLGKLETKLGGAMDEGRKAGYQVIAAMLSPKSDPIAGIFTTPLDTAAAAMAQGDLDNWLDEQKADNKSPTIQEIRTKSISFAAGRTVSFADKLPYIKGSAEAAKASLGK